MSHFEFFQNLDSLIDEQELANKAAKLFLEKEIDYEEVPEMDS